MEKQMTNSKHDGHLGAVYDAKQPAEIASHYDSWADSYDADMAVAGYRHPAICLALLSRYLPCGAEPLLDAGAGTGLVGEWLGIMGYPHVEALDISEGMLAVAREKQIYSELHNLALGGPLPFSDNAFAGIISAGVFTTGHVGAHGVDELIRICQPGGVIVLTVKETLWSEAFAAHVSDLEDSAKVTLVEQTSPYVSMPGEAATIPSRGVVIKVC